MRDLLAVLLTWTQGLGVCGLILAGVILACFLVWLLFSQEGQYRGGGLVWLAGGAAVILWGLTYGVWSLGAWAQAHSVSHLLGTG